MINQRLIYEQIVHSISNQAFHLLHGSIGIRKTDLGGNRSFKKMNESFHFGARYYKVCSSPFAGYGT